MIFPSVAASTVGTIQAECRGPCVSCQIQYAFLTHTGIGHDSFTVKRKQDLTMTHSRSSESVTLGVCVSHQGF